MSTCVGRTPVKLFFNQTTHSTVMIKNPNALYMPIIRSRMKILAASDMESDYAIHCTWVLSPHLYKCEQCMYNSSPERNQYVMVC